MFGLGTSELLIILLVVLVIFGPSQLPKLGKTLGETLRSLRGETHSGDKSDPEKKS